MAQGASLRVWLMGWAHPQGIPPGHPRPQDRPGHFFSSRALNCGPGHKQLESSWWQREPWENSDSCTQVCLCACLRLLQILLCTQTLSCDTQDFRLLRLSPGRNSSIVDFKDCRHVSKIVRLLGVALLKQSSSVVQTNETHLGLVCLPARHKFVFS